MKIKANFLPGSNWLFYKVYIGEGYSNKFLIEKITPFIKQSLDKKLIIQWFFVRYHDPEHHLRIRIFCESEADLMKVIYGFEELCRDVLGQGLIYEIQIATYKRELFRYGEQNMESVEKLWHYESDYVLSSIEHHDNKVEHVLSMIMAVHLYLNKFCPKYEHKLEYVNNNYLLYVNEFSLKKWQKRKLADKFRDIHEQIDFLLYPREQIEEGIPTHPIHFAYVSLIEQISDLAPNLCSSLVHMLVNRGFDRSQREMELVIYHHLGKFYQSRNARFGKI